MKRKVLIFGVGLFVTLLAFAEPSITVTARQRYPWNGLVDIDCTVTDMGNPVLAFVAKDNEDGQYLPVKSLTLDGNSFVNGTSSVTDGTYRFIWNAAADVEAGYVATNITLTVCNGFPKYMVIDLSAGATASFYPVEYFDEIPGGDRFVKYKTTKLVMRLIPGQNNQKSPFYVGVFEVTQKQYALVMRFNPSEYKGDARPVEMVSWTELTRSNGFIDRMRKKTGWRTLNLPSEAQWEYACRAGTTTSFNNGTSSIAGLGRYSENNSDGKGGYAEHTEVGSYLPNAWGLYDMHGNVWEWTATETSELSIVLCGGGWCSVEARCASSYFYHNTKSPGDSIFGFRLFCFPGL